jgi:metal-responsive CopG/Arc/MetJ family transcriptional regulator
MAVGKNRVRLSGVSIDRALNVRIDKLQGKSRIRTRSKYIEDLLYEAVRSREAFGKMDDGVEDMSDWE